MINKDSINRKTIVSIVCVCYNQVDFIEKTIKGFLSQKTAFDFEVIIGDDCSTDGTTEIILEYQKNNIDVIKPIIRGKNIGGGRNLINCLEKATGDYIAYCEGDDYWIDDFKLQKQYNLLESNCDAGLVWTDIDLNDLQGKKVVKSVFKNSHLPIFSNFEEILINKPFFAPSTWFYRKQYKNLFSNYLDYADGTLPFILDVIMSTKILYINEVTGVYTKRSESTSNNINPIKRYNFAKSVYKIQLDYSNKYCVSDVVIKNVKINHYKSLLHYAIIAKDYDFIKNANSTLKECKNIRTIFLLFISRYTLLSTTFRYFFTKIKF